MIQVTSSPCHIVKNSDSVRSTIHAMQNAKKSYAIVQNGRGECLGIFTDRDILRRFFDLQGDALDKPITSIMTTPVTMLPLALMHQAPAVMQQKHIRHVPIYDEIDGHLKIIGVITLERLAAENLLNKTAENPYPAPNYVPNAIGVISADGNSMRFIEKLYSPPTTSVTRLFFTQLVRHPDLAGALAGFDSLIFDIDDVPETSWKWLISAFNGMSPPIPVALLLTLEHHSPKIIEALQTIAKSGWLSVFSKPLDLVALDLDLRRRHRFTENAL